MHPVNFDHTIQRLDALHDHKDTPAEAKELIAIYKKALTAAQNGDHKGLVESTNQYVSLRANHAVTPGIAGTAYSIGDLSSVGRLLVPVDKSLLPVVGETTGTSGISGLVGMWGNAERLSNQLLKGDDLAALTEFMDLLFFNTAIALGGGSYQVARQAAIFGAPHLSNQSALIGNCAFGVFYVSCIFQGIRNLFHLDTDILMEGVDVPLFGSPTIDEEIIKQQLFGSLGEDIAALKELAAKQGKKINEVLDTLSDQHYRHEYRMIRGKGLWDRLFTKETDKEKTQIDNLKKAGFTYWKSSMGILSKDFSIEVEQSKKEQNKMIEESVVDVIKRRLDIYDLDLGEQGTLAAIDSLEQLHGLSLFMEHRKQVRLAQWSRYIGEDAVKEILVGKFLDGIKTTWDSTKQKEKETEINEVKKEYDKQVGAAGKAHIPLDRDLNNLSDTDDLRWILDRIDQDDSKWALKINLGDSQPVMIICGKSGITVEQREAVKAAINDLKGAIEKQKEEEERVSERSLESGYSGLEQEETSSISNQDDLRKDIATKTEKLVSLLQDWEASEEEKKYISEKRPEILKPEILLPDEASKNLLAVNTPPSPPSLDNRITKKIWENRRVNCVLVVLGVAGILSLILAPPIGALVVGILVFMFMIYLDAPDMIARFKEAGQVKSGDRLVAGIQCALALVATITASALFSMGVVALSPTLPILVPLAILGVWMGIDFAYAGRLVYRDAKWEEGKLEWKDLKSKEVEDIRLADLQRILSIEEVAKSKLDFYASIGKINAMQYRIYQETIQTALVKAKSLKDRVQPYNGRIQSLLSIEKNGWNKFIESLGGPEEITQVKGQIKTANDALVYIKLEFDRLEEELDKTLSLPEPNPKSIDV